MAMRVVCIFAACGILAGCGVVRGLQAQAGYILSGTTDYKAPIVEAATHKTEGASSPPPQSPKLRGTDISW